MIFNLQIFGGSGAGSRKKGGSGGSNNEQETYVRGIPQSQIDQLRGTRGHLGKDELTTNLIKEDYARVGIKISESEAEQIHEALQAFTDNNYSNMREAYIKQLTGKSLSSFEKDDLFRYRRCMEYLKIAPSFETSSSYIYRGIEIDKNGYTDKLLKMKPSDKWDVDKMPTSFTTEVGIARNYADVDGIIISMPTQKLKNSTSVQGLSRYNVEEEVLVGDYKWKVKSIGTLENHLNIVLEPDN